jgi:hypothetical protein
MLGISAAKNAFGAAIAIAIAMSVPAAAQEGPQEGTVEAFSSWEARGQIYPTGPEEATFVGVMSGILYVTGADDSMDAGLITCPGVLVINTEDGSQSGKAKCVIITPDAERIYAEFTCSGVYMEGCNGEFTLKGGTGDKENISGGGPILLKSAFANLASISGNIVEQSAIGLAVWPKLNYKIP